jgi:hypothetical protein
MTESILGVELWATIRFVIMKYDCPKDQVFMGTQCTTMVPVSTRELHELLQDVVILTNDLNEDIATKEYSSVTRVQSY